jgi:hypothetical protein
MGEPLCGSGREEPCPQISQIRTDKSRLGLGRSLPLLPPVPRVPRVPFFPENGAARARAAANHAKPHLPLPAWQPKCQTRL